MNFRNICVSVVILSIIILFISCSQEKTEWKGTVEEIDGVTVIRNPKEPMYGPDVLRLTEDLCLGEAEGREAYMFSRISFDVDAAGNIYVLDLKDADIRVFDAEGRFTRTIGRQGQGPGEFQSPYTVIITPGSQIFVQDGRSRLMSLFSLEGRYLKRVSAANHLLLLGLKIDTESNAVAVFSEFESSGIRKYDPEFKPIFTVFELPRDPKELNTGYLPGPDMGFSLLPTDYIVWGYSTEYLISVVNPQGRLVKKISRAWDPVPVSPQRKQAMMNRIYPRGLPPGRNIVWADHFPAFCKIACDDEGRIFVTTYEYVGDGMDSCLIDVFDSMGRYMAAFPLALPNNHSPLICKNGKLYAIDENPDGYLFIKRYAITWNI